MFCFAPYSVKSSCPLLAAAVLTIRSGTGGVASATYRVLPSFCVRTTAFFPSTVDCFTPGCIGESVLLGLAARPCNVSEPTLADLLGTLIHLSASPAAFGPAVLVQYCAGALTYAVSPIFTMCRTTPPVVTVPDVLLPCKRRSSFSCCPLLVMVPLTCTEAALNNADFASLSTCGADLAASPPPEPLDPELLDAELLEDELLDPELLDAELLDVALPEDGLPDPDEPHAARPATNRTATPHTTPVRLMLTTLPPVRSPSLRSSRQVTLAGESP